MREKYESLSVTVLRDLAKARGLKNLSGRKKSELVELMLAEDEKEALKAGMNVHLAKPVNVDVLKQVIKQCTAKRES